MYSCSSSPTLKELVLRWHTSGVISGSYDHSQKADLATERERQLTTARANQTIVLTNG